MDLIATQSFFHDPVPLESDGKSWYRMLCVRAYEYVPLWGGLCHLTDRQKEHSLDADGGSPPRSSKTLADSAHIRVAAVGGMG